MFGGGPQSNKVYLIDFGISKVYENNLFLTFNKNKSFIGTSRYASLASHNGEDIGKKDEIESLMYILLYLLEGKLPWQNLHPAPGVDKNTAIRDLKLSISLEELCQGAPKEFI